MIFHSVTAPGYPVTNGLVERYLGEFKDKLDKIRNTSETLQTPLGRFLLMNRITPTASEKSPFQLLMNRETRLRFSALRAKSEEKQLFSQAFFFFFCSFFCLFKIKFPVSLSKIFFPFCKKTEAFQC